MNWKKFALNLFLLAIVMLVSQVLLAQPGGGPPDGGGGPGCWPPPCIPIDGGVSFLVAAGIAFGGKKLYDLRSK